MKLRHDALAGAAEWIALVESMANGSPGLIATVGRLEIEPGAVNVIAGSVRAPDHLFRVIGGIMLILIVIPAVLA